MFRAREALLIRPLDYKFRSLRNRMHVEKLTELIHLSANLGSVLAVVTKGNVICVGYKEIKCLL